MQDLPQANLNSTISEYLVLARRYRPKNFAEVLGQQASLQALINSLNNNRIHHAYLFTGTRGVGKTTIARILAKALNCQQGVSSSPCCVCENCLAIDKGSFVDVTEIDAASRTKVEDTREILENISFAPISGRYKIYLIDEVHMLSTSSFNALLKTLEEPPKHVKFLFATTNPEKLPITVLSRVLEFKLKAFSADEINQYLLQILKQEQINFEDKAVAIIAKAAKGSIRDGLSILDQAIAYDSQLVSLSKVEEMLGYVGSDIIWQILGLIQNHEVAALENFFINQLNQILDFESVIDQLIETIYQVTLYKNTRIIWTANQLLDHNSKIQEFAALEMNQLELMYKLMLETKANLKYLPDTNIAFQMLILRLFTVKPASINLEYDFANLEFTEPAKIIQPKTNLADNIKPATEPAVIKPALDSLIKNEQVDETPTKDPLKESLNNQISNSQPLTQTELDGQLNSNENNNYSANLSNNQPQIQNNFNEPLATNQEPKINPSAVLQTNALQTETSAMATSQTGTLQTDNFINNPTDDLTSSLKETQPNEDVNKNLNLENNLNAFNLVNDESGKATTTSLGTNSLDSNSLGTNSLGKEYTAADKLDDFTAANSFSNPVAEANKSETSSDTSTDDLINFLTDDFQGTPEEEPIADFKQEITPTAIDNSSDPKETHDESGLNINSADRLSADRLNSSNLLDTFNNLVSQAQNMQAPESAQTLTDEPRKTPDLVAPVQQAVTPTQTPQLNPTFSLRTPEDYAKLVEGIDFDCFAKSLADKLKFISYQNNRLAVFLDNDAKFVRTDLALNDFQTKLKAKLGENLIVDFININDQEANDLEKIATPQDISEQKQQAIASDIQENFDNDAKYQLLKQAFSLKEIKD